jgi:predicted GNAT family acetyltransferase
MWQLGIDVLPDYRYQGIGRALVSRLTAAVLQKGILPYYTTTVSNIASRRIATSLGYLPAWVELYSADKPAV